MSFDAFGNYSGLAFAQNSYNQTQNFLNNQQQVYNNAQNAWNGVTGNLTQDPAYYAAQGIAYQGQIGPVSDPGTYGAWGSRSGYSSPTPSVFDTGADPVPYPNAQQTWSDQMDQLPGGRYGGFGGHIGGMSSYQPNSTYSPSQYTPTPQQPMYGSPSPGYDPNQFMQASTPWQSYGQPGVGGGSPSSNGVNLASAWGYLQSNPDVMRAALASGQDPTAFAQNHFNTYGQNEGRAFGDTTSTAAHDYLGAYGDVAAAKPAGMSDNQWAQQHYSQYGANEGRDAFGLMAGGFVGPGGSASAGVSPVDAIAQQLTFNNRWGNTPWAAGAGPKLPPEIEKGTSSGNPFGQHEALDPLTGLTSDGSPQGDTFADRFGAAPTYDPNSFANRFGAGQYFQPGTPSQMYTGTQYPHGPLPGNYHDASRYPGMPSQDTLAPGDYFPSPVGPQSSAGTPPVMAQGDDGGDPASFNDRWAALYGDNSMYNFQSPASGYQNFQNRATPSNANPISGTASTYDPTAPGWRTGGMQTANGQTYDPAAYTAAIQTSLRNRFGGVPYGQTPAQGLVQGPGGMQAVVDVNDTGPLTKGRVIDLSTRAMQYFNPSATPNSGLLPNTTVTPLPGGGYPTGPTGPVGMYGPMQAAPGIPLPNYGRIGPTFTRGYVGR